MNQENQVGFFRRYFIACFQPGKYKLLLEKKTGSHVIYMILLVAFLLIVDTLIPFGAWMTSVGGFRNLFLNRLPAFTLEDGTFDYDGIRAAINENTKLVEIQRSKGYLTRPTFSVEQIGELISFIKGIKSDVICMVDNCYGEFVERLEPSDVGADLVVGSLIKNPGGGLAPIGGYIAGKEEYVDMKKAGIVDPTKVSRSALQNAVSIASMILTTESLVTDKKEPKECSCGGHDNAGDMGGMY